MSILKKIFIITLFFLLCIYQQSCNDIELYTAGSGTSVIVNIDSIKYKGEYYQLYAPSFFKTHPEFRPSKADEALKFSINQPVIKYSVFYFQQFPEETYCVQWQGTGFVNVRLIYDYETKQMKVVNDRVNSDIDNKEKNRIKDRFKSKILNSLDSIIGKSKDSLNAKI